MKARRQALILQLLDRELVHNQEQLRRGLEGLGVHATQATISRDIKQLGLLKRASDGAYQNTSSNHPGGCNVLFGDGSVKFIKGSIDIKIWWGLGTRNGGEVISADSY